MALRIGINGFGRIGRNVLRAGWDQEGLEFVHLNDLTSADSLAYLLQHDSVHGGWKSVKAVDGGLEIDGRLVRVSAEREPGKLPWGEAGVDVVLECTGRFTEGPKAQPHRDAGAPKVIISAPASKVDATFVVGVNHGTYDRAAHHIVSNASCTTNCLAPLAKVLHETVGIERGLMTTVHSYTMDQNLLDAPHKDFRRSRAAALNMVPTSTGAAKAIGLVLPAIAGRLNGVAIRVPTPNGSLVDLPVEVDAEARQFRDQIGAPRLIGNQHATHVADAFRRHMFVGSRIGENRRGVNAGLGGEGAGADIGRMAVWRAVEQFVERMRDARQMRKFLARHADLEPRCELFFQEQGRNDRRQIGVAATLSQTV